jgi:hypothetical protein
MGGMRPWGVAGDPFRDVVYENARRDQASGAPLPPGFIPSAIPGQLLDESATAMLICKVLVPFTDAFHFFNPPSIPDAVFKPYYHDVPSPTEPPDFLTYCRPLLLVHVKLPEN